MKAKHTERFGLVLCPEIREALRFLAEREHLPEASIVRLLIWRAYKSGEPLFPSTLFGAGVSVLPQGENHE
jgi:hypothetical protein